MAPKTLENPAADPIGVRILVTTAHPSLSQHTLDGERHPNLGRLIQPRHTSSIEATAAAGITWAADNDCFQGLDAPAYVRMLDRLVGLEGCRFVTVPDVVGDAVATFELFDRWIVELETRGLPAALVAQDGLETMLDRVQWDRISAIFIGGSTEWKEGPAAAAIALEAKARGKWVHWGRVNTRRRFDLIVSSGAVDSWDGSKWARFRKTYLDQGLAWCRETAGEPGKVDTMSPKYRFSFDAEARDATDAAILSDVVAGAVVDERNDPEIVVEVDFEPVIEGGVEVVLFDGNDLELGRAECEPAAAALTGATLWDDARRVSVATGGGPWGAPKRLRYYVDGTLIRQLDGRPIVIAELAGARGR